MLDLAQLLQPISTDNSAGIDLRETANANYLALKDARTLARQQERDALHNENVEKNLDQWRKIYELAPKVLTQESKDLTVAAWLTESLIRLHSFAGLQQGIALLAGLVEQFWSDIYPHEDEDGIITKLAPIIGLNGDNSEGTLIAPINSIPLTKSNNLSVAVWQYQQAISYSKITEPDKIAKLTKDGAITLDKVKEAVLETPVAHFAELEIILQTCLDTFTNFKNILDQLCASQFSTPTSNISQALKTCLETVQTFKRMVEPNHIANSTEETINRGQPDQTNYISSKQQAFKTLREIADYFRQHEPHSPVPYLLEQAVRWGNLTLPELLAEVILDPQMLAYSQRLIGISTTILNQQRYSEDN